MAEQIEKTERAERTERADKADMTPVPTQQQLDELSGGKDHKAEKPKAPEHLEPYPSQKDNDEWKAKLFNTTVEEDKKRNAEYVKAHGGDKSTKDAEDMTPVPTQAELDAVKKEIMFEPEDAPGGGTDPQKRKSRAEGRGAEGRAENRSIEAERPAGNYQTRTIHPEPHRTPGAPKGE